MYKVFDKHYGQINRRSVNTTWSAVGDYPRYQGQTVHPKNFTEQQNPKSSQKNKRNNMNSTKDISEITNGRIQNDPELAILLLDEALSLFLNGEADTARLVLRDLVNATIGFEGLATATAKPSKSLHRMLSANGNPTMDNLTVILGVLRRELRVDIHVQTIACA
jgi:DNA-binding phage protein